METKKLNEQESLDLIAQMINNTRNHMVAGQGNVLLIWGYISVIVSLGVLLLLHITQSINATFGFFAIPVIGVVIAVAYNRNHPKSVKTYVDRVIGHLWLVLGVAMSVAPFILNLGGHGSMSLFTEGMLGTIGIIVTALIIRFRPMLLGGIAAGVLTCLLPFFGTNYVNAILIFSGIFVVSMIIPGHILNNEAKRCLKN